MPITDTAADDPDWFTRLSDLAEALVDALTHPAPDWHRIARDAAELTQLAERRAASS